MLDWLKRFEENSVHAPHGVHRIEAKLALLRLRGTARPAWNVGGDGPELEAIADRSETSDPELSTRNQKLVLVGNGVS
jgi:hypothetical protein